MADESTLGEDIISSEEELEDDDEDEGEAKSPSSSAASDKGESVESMEAMEGGESQMSETPMDVSHGGSPAVVPPPAVSEEKSDDDDEGEEEDDGEESSYRSSPPESPPMSPEQPPEPPRHAEPPPPPRLSPNHGLSSVAEMAKESMDDQEGELDFEEDTVEDGKEENDAEPVTNNAEHDKMKVEKDLEPVKKEEVKVVSEGGGSGGGDPDDDGEVEDDDDLEEGEVKDSSSNRKVPQRPMCRFFHKGQCTWGNNCRFLHPGVNDKGNYNMFAAPKAASTANGPNSIYTWHAAGTRQDSYYNKGFSEAALPPPPPPPLVVDEPHRESAWERGLRHAKEILKKSSQRKEMEPDFEEKRMNLSLSSGEVYNEYEKENDFYSRTSPYRRNSDRYSYEFDDPMLDPYDRQAHDYWRGGNYENFEVRYMRSDYEYRDDGRGDRMREADRGRMERVREREREVYHVDRERDGRSRRDKFERQHTPERSWRDEHYTEAQSQSRNRGDEWRDPWRRSTSPKRVNQSRSYSSNSSASYSSSRSSGSHSSYTSASRSSSASSHSSYSSRSYSRTRMHVKPQVQHKTYVEQVPISSRRTKIPPPPAGGQQIHHARVSRHQQDKWASSSAVPPPPVQVIKAPSPVAILMDKKKVKNNPNRAVIRGGSLSSTGSSRSSRSGSSHSSTSRSRSRSSSASSLESVSSKSSISSKSSYGSQPKAQVSSAPGFKRVDDRHLKDKRKMYDNSGSGKVVEKVRETKVNPQVQPVLKSAPGAAKALSKDPLKQSGQKTQIKLTLLNKEKAATANTAAVATHRREAVEVKRPKIVEREPAPKPVKAPPVILPQNRKRAASPSHPGPDTTTANTVKPSSKAAPQASATSAPSKNPSVAAISALNKKSTSSRREELLKQLKAVEDAIARKRAKLS